MPLGCPLLCDAATPILCFLCGTASFTYMDIKDIDRHVYGKHVVLRVHVQTCGFYQSETVLAPQNQSPTALPDYDKQVTFSVYQSVATNGFALNTTLCLMHMVDVHFTSTCIYLLVNVICRG